MFENLTFIENNNEVLLRELDTIRRVRTHWQIEALKNNDQYLSDVQIGQLEKYTDSLLDYYNNDSNELPNSTIFGIHDLDNVFAQTFVNRSNGANAHDSIIPTMESIETFSILCLPNDEPIGNVLMTILIENNYYNHISTIEEALKAPKYEWENTVIVAPLSAGYLLLKYAQRVLSQLGEKINVVPAIPSLKSRVDGTELPQLLPTDEIINHRSIMILDDVYDPHLIDQLAIAFGKDRVIPQVQAKRYH